MLRRGDTDLASAGLRVLRFDNVQVLKEIEGVMDVLLRSVAESLEENPPNPPFAEGRTDRPSFCKGNYIQLPPTML